MPPLVSVVVPVRDDDRLRSCLDALAAQTLPAAAVEVVVVDNGSAAPVTVPAGVRLLTEPRRGSYAARNRGLAACRAPVVAFTDADCLPAPEWLECGLAALASGPDVVTGPVEVFPAVPGRPGGFELYDALTAFPQEHFVARFGFGVTANLLVRRPVFDAVGPFDPTLRSGGDAEWGERATAAGHPPAYRPEVLVRHPARRSLAELVEKTRRTTRGVEQIAARKGGAPPLVLAAADRLTRPWRALPSVLRDERLPSAWDKTRFQAVSVLAAGLIAAEISRARAADAVRRRRPARPATAPG